MTATRDFLEATSNELNQAVLRAKEAVTDEKLLRIATRCQQVLEDAWIKHNAAHALYASKLKEPALKAESQAIWLGEMRSYEAALDSLEEYLENLQEEQGAGPGADEFGGMGVDDAPPVEDKGGKKKKNKKKEVEDEAFDDSEDDDRQDREVDYMSDESSDSEEEEEEKADAKGGSQCA